MIKRNYLILFIVFLALILALYACSRGDRAAIDESSLFYGDSLSTRSSLEDVREDIVNYEKPDDIDAEIFDMLIERFLEELELLAEDRGASQAQNTPPLNFKMVNGGAGITALSWRYYNPGDYNLDGEVTIADVSQIARYYLADTTDGVDDTVESFVDGDNNGEITIADVAEIARSYLYAYDVSIGIFVNEPSSSMNLEEWITSAAFENHGALPVGGLTGGAVELSLNRDEEDILGRYGRTSYDESSAELASLSGDLFIGVRDYSDVPNFVSIEPFLIGESNMPVISEVLPVSGATGTEVTFSASVGGATPFEYSWDFGGGATPNTSVDSNPIVTLGDIGEYDLSLTVTNDYGSDAFGFLFAVEAMAPPVINSVSPIEGPAGEEATFTADITAFQPLTFSWDFGGGATPNTSSEPSPTVLLNSSAGDFPASLTLENPGGADTFNFTLTVTAGPMPPTVISVSPTGGMSAEPVVFSADVDGSTPFSYDWNFGGGATPNTSVDSNPVVTLGDVGDYPANLTVTNAYGNDTFAFNLIVSSSGGAWVSEIVDYGGSNKVGEWADLEYTLDGEPMIAYTAQIGATNYVLKVAKKTGGNWDKVVVDDGGGGLTGQYASLEVSSSGTPYIAYMFTGSDPFSYDLRLASFDGTSWGYELIRGDGSGNNTNARWADLSIGESGNMYISHIFWEGPGDPPQPFISKLLAFDGSGWTESEVAVSAWTSASIIDSDGNPIVATHPIDPEFKIRWFNGSSWDVYDLQPAQDVSDWYVSMALAPDGNPSIAWFVKGDGVSIDKDLMYAKWSGSVWDVETAVDAGDAGRYCSLAFSPGGTPYISFNFVDDRSLKVARKTGGFWTSDTVDDGEGGLYRTGRYTSIAFDSGGKPTIAYYQWESGERALKFAWQE